MCSACLLAVCCSALQGVVMCYSVLQCVAVCCSVVAVLIGFAAVQLSAAVCSNALQCDAV